MTAIQGTAIHPPALRPPQPSAVSLLRALPMGSSVSAVPRTGRPVRSTARRFPRVPIARLVEGGAFPVFHTPEIGNPSELNDAAVNAALVKALRAPVTSCLGTRQPPTEQARGAPGHGAHGGPHGGSLGKTASGDVALGLGSVSVTCGGKAPGRVTAAADLVAEDVCHGSACSCAARDRPCGAITQHALERRSSRCRAGR